VRERPARRRPLAARDFCAHASTTLTELTWNATAIDGDVASFVDDLKRNAGQNLLRYGNGPLDATLMKHGLIDEFHLFLK